MNNNDLLLEIKNLKVQYKADHGLVHGVNDLNLKLYNSETLGFIGETGAGKTTTVMSIMKLISETTGIYAGGEILYKGEDLLKKNNKEMRKIRGKEIAMIFQDPMTSLNPVMTVGEQIEEMIVLHNDVSPGRAKEMVLESLQKVGIRPERYADYPHQFSGGMKQRVVIAIALACSPKLLIADEPTTALDVTIQAQVLELMKELKKEFGMSMLMITHDLGIVADICDTVAIMYAGGIVEYADKTALYQKPSHPYTLGLFNSIPDIDAEDVHRLQEITGLPPDPTMPLKGCSFCPRCDQAMEKCHNQKPGMYKIGENHFVNCFLYEGAGE